MPVVDGYDLSEDPRRKKDCESERDVLLGCTRAWL